MLLVDRQICKYINKGKISILPYFYECIQPNSYDVRLGHNYRIFDSDNNDIVDLAESCSYPKSKMVSADTMIIKPHEFMLAETFEKVSLPDNISCLLEGRSSFARLGLSIHQTGGWIDAGFTGTITLELYNASNRPIMLYSGTRIGQLLFFKTKRCSRPYGHPSLNSRYQGQNTPTVSRLSYFSYDIEGEIFKGRNNETN